MKLYLGLCVCVALLVGCSSKEEQSLLKSYASNTSYHKHLQRTEKTELYDNNNSVAILTATYMYTPNFEKNDTRDEVFIVGVLFENDDDSKMNFDINSTFSNKNDYILTLNNKHAINVVPLDKNDKRLKGISFVTTWGDYYEVTYPHAGQRFTLVFQNSKYGKGTLNFAKVAKFVYTKKGF